MTQAEAINRSLALERKIGELKQQFWEPIDPEVEAMAKEQMKRIRKEMPDSEERRIKLDTLNELIKKKPVSDERKMELRAEIKILQKESDELWEYAKSQNEERLVKKSYEDLANAVIKRAVLDYEALISGRGTGESGSIVNIPEILSFAKGNTFTKIDIYGTLEKIKRVREKEFVPYVAKHQRDIVLEYLQLKKKKVNTTSYNDIFSHRCPVCGGAMIPTFIKDHRNGEAKFEGVGCVNCETYVYKKEADNYLAGMKGE